MPIRHTVHLLIEANTSGQDLDRLLWPAARCLAEGGLVAFPTETVYGLGANALSAEAVAQIFAAKGRPGDNPLIVHVDSIESIKPLTTELTPLAIFLLQQLTPGPLTLILPRSSLVPDLVTAGLDTVAVRIPAHPIARRLIELAQVPVAAPSANRSGKPSPTRAWHVAEDLTDRIDYLIDGGACEFGLESTVLDLTGSAPVVLRPGAVPAEVIQTQIDRFMAMPDNLPANLMRPSPLEVSAKSPSSTHAPKSPGMKYRHYAPAAELVIIDRNTPQERAAKLAAIILDLRQNNTTPKHPFRMGIYLSVETYNYLPAELRYAQSEQTSDLDFHFYAEKAEAAAASHHLFDALRKLDQLSVNVILAEGLPEGGAATAYMNRLRKAASGGEVPE